MKTAWRFYDKTTGIFCPHAMVLPTEEAVAANTPDGCAAVFGEIDHLSQRVDVATGELVDWQPPAPPDTELLAHAWDAHVKRWLASPTTAAIAVTVRAERAARLAACDWTQVTDSPLAPATRKAWAAYRKALREISAQAGFPTEVEWPTPPA